MRDDVGIYEPDEFFNGEQLARSKVLFDRWRTARDSGEPLPVEDQAELEVLTMIELKASGLRAKALSAHNR